MGEPHDGKSKKSKNKVHLAHTAVVTTLYIALSQVLDKQLLMSVDHNSSLRCLQQAKYYKFFFSILEHEEEEMENLKTACNIWRTFSMRVNFPNLNSVKLFPWGWIFLSRTMWISTCQILTRTLLTSPKLNESRQYHHIEWFFSLPLVGKCVFYLNSVHMLTWIRDMKIHISEKILFHFFPLSNQDTMDLPGLPSAINSKRFGT